MSGHAACNAVEAIEEVDHGESLVNQDWDFDIDITPEKVQALNSIVYFNQSLEEGSLEDLELEEFVSDDQLERYEPLLEDDIEDVLSNEELVGDGSLLEDVDVERIKQDADEHSLTDDQIKTAIEIESRVTDIQAATSAETPVQEGHVACTTVAACVGAVVLAVIAGTVYQTVAVYTTAAATVVATVAIGVNTTVGTGHY